MAPQDADRCKSGDMDTGPEQDECDENTLDEDTLDENTLIEDELDDDALDAEEDRLAELFADPRFAEAAAQRAAIAPVASKSSNGSIGRAMALGFANVFDPDRQRDEVVAVQKRGDDDPDGPSTDLDRDNPKSSRITLRRKK